MCLPVQSDIASECSVARNTLPDDKKSSSSLTVVCVSTVLTQQLKFTDVFLLEGFIV